VSGAEDLDSALARQALKDGLITPKQLQEVILEQAREKSKGKSRSLSALLIERGYLKDAKTPAAVGKYRLIRELGRGGMGVVHEAMDVELGRKVALKTMIANGDPQEEERFIREAQLAARLPKHPHIVGVYEAGVVDGRRFIAMELIEGEPLSEWRRHERGAPKEEVEILRDAARAVHHAHEGGIIHRDLKPANILVDRQGKPHISDFGLAKTVGRDVNLSLTGAGMVVGTPAYISPEQAQGLKSTDRRTDVYALGVILYETITGRPPFVGESAMEILMKAAKNPVPAPTSLIRIRLSPAQARGLENICLKALQKNVKDRYPTAAAFAADLERWLKGDEIKTLVRTRRVAVPRPRPWVALAAAGTLAACLGTVALFRPSALPPAPPPAAVDNREEKERIRKLEAELKAMTAKLQPAAVHRDPASLRPGVVAEFFSGANFDVPCVRRVEAKIEYDGKSSWSDAPSEIGSFRWSGYLDVPESGPYTFRSFGPDGARLFIDEVEVFSLWRSRNPSTDSGALMLAKGLHRIRYERFQGAIQGGVSFGWTGAGTLLHDPAGLALLARKPAWEHADRSPLPNAQEAEALPILYQTPEATFVLPFGRGKGILVWAKNTKPGDVLRLRFNAEKPVGTLILGLGRSKNAGIVSIAVNGRVVLPKADLYNAHTITLEVEFKDLELKVGPNELEFAILGSNPAAVEWKKGDGVHKMALDYVRIR
jgi:predicted Ser/Thr protein kinase